MQDAVGSNSNDDPLPQIEAAIDSEPPTIVHLEDRDEERELLQELVTLEYGDKVRLISAQYGALLLRKLFDLSKPGEQHGPRPRLVKRVDAGIFDLNQRAFDEEVGKPSPTGFYVADTVRHMFGLPEQNIAIYSGNSEARSLIRNKNKRFSVFTKPTPFGEIKKFLDAAFERRGVKIH